jgi:histidine triad (HIT) family protein
VPLELPPDDPCWFCLYLTGIVPYTILERDDVTATLVTFEQRGRGHVVVMPVRHAAAIVDLTPNEQWAVMDGVVRASQAIVGAFDPAGIAVWQNNGIPAHQTVPHVHVHVAGTLAAGGTQWGPVPRLPTSRTDELAGVLRPHLPARERGVHVARMPPAD